MTLEKTLWPYGTVAALLSAFLVFVIGLVALLVLRATTGWPTEAGLDRIVPILLIVSLTPLVLAVLDFLAERRAVVGSKWFNLDLSRVDLAKTASTETAFLPANLGISGPVISDSSPMDIVAALRSLTRQPFAVINIGNGDAWWVTRLLALSAGAVRRGDPEVIVFVGRRENQPDQFLGWARPDIVLDAILGDRDAYRERYEKAVVLARHLAFFQGGDILPPGVQLHHDVHRYTMPPHNYSELGEAALEQIVMDQLGQYGPEGSLEQPPDHLTLARMNSLLGPILVTENIDIDSASSQQVQALLETRWPFVALVRKGTFVAMVRRADAERALLKQLVDQAQS